MKGEQVLPVDVVLNGGLVRLARHGVGGHQLLVGLLDAEAELGVLAADVSVEAGPLGEVGQVL